MIIKYKTVHSSYMKLAEIQQIAIHKFHHFRMALNWIDMICQILIKNHMEEVSTKEYLLEHL